ncbi:MAG: ABC transporter ATP-binding protein [Candidatus Heimdallarchaeota archaeon]|nr:ABC transporter ATP-binding protein [Candidatus Heimdallarchaeota archaeon]
MSTTRIKCEHLTKAYTNQFGINDITIDLEFKGLGLLGPNGSGKTTLIKTLLGIISPTSGSFTLDVPIEDIRIVSDQPSLPGNMTINEWIFTLENIYGQQLQGVDVQSDLGLQGNWKIKNLSAGQKRKTALLSAFYGTPKLLILDEPSNYLDITTREYVLTLLKAHCETTKANIIISTHNVDEIRLFASDVILLKEGRLMEHVVLEDAQAEMISLKPKNLDRLSNELTKLDVKHHYNKTLQGEVINAEPDNNMWLAVKNYVDKGGKIYSMKVIDLLEKMIEDLTK